MSSMYSEVLKDLSDVNSVQSGVGRHAKKHYGDPCIHCATPHDDVPVGPCKGDANKARVIAYCVDRQAWQNPGSGCDNILCLMSTGEITIDTRHPMENWPWSDWYKDARTMSRQDFRAQYMRSADR